MSVIAAVNLKGGVGKTSTCLHLAGPVSTRRRLLLVDNDPQSSLTSGFLGPADSLISTLRRPSPRFTRARSPSPRP